MATQEKLAKVIVDAFRQRGVRRLFGVPGGGSSLDLIDAAVKNDVDFVLCRTETSAAIMASVAGELSGKPGGVLAGIGPGAASMVNGVAYAFLECAPLIAITDSRDERPNAIHQVIDQGAIFAPVTKASERLTENSSAGRINEMFDVALSHPRGPVHFDMTSKAASAMVDVARDSESIGGSSSCAGALIEVARALERAQRPIIIVGLEARTDACARGVIDISEKLNAPVLVTYKAKGVVPDEHPLFTGVFTGARTEAKALGQADIILFYGVDAIEIIPGNWGYSGDLVTINEGPYRAMPCEPRFIAWGGLDCLTQKLNSSLEKTASTWSHKEVAKLRSDMRTESSLKDARMINTANVVETVQDIAADNYRVSVDSGAHMFSAMGLWKAKRPHDVLKSNGLSTMGFAVPAAIASSLEESNRPVIAFTGDAGLMMCLSELSTAVRLGCNITVIVLNDAALSLIDIKQQRQQRPSVGVRYPDTNFSRTAEGLGCRSWRVDSINGLVHAFKASINVEGPSLIDVTVDPTGYAEQLEVLRG